MSTFPYFALYLDKRLEDLLQASPQLRQLTVSDGSVVQPPNEVGRHIAVTFPDLLRHGNDAERRLPDGPGIVMLCSAVDVRDMVVSSADLPAPPIGDTTDAKMRRMVLQLLYAIWSRHWQMKDSVSVWGALHPHFQHPTDINEEVVSMLTSNDLNGQMRGFHSGPVLLSQDKGCLLVLLRDEVDRRAVQELINRAEAEEAQLEKEKEEDVRIRRTTGRRAGEGDGGRCARVSREGQSHAGG